RVLDGCRHFCDDAPMGTARFVIGVVGLALLALGPLSAAAVAAEPTSLRIEVYGLMGLHVLTLHSTIDEAGDHYAITTDYATRGTVDNLTAYFMLERQLAKTGSCALDVPVFDGRHRYDLQFADAGRKKLPPVSGQQFEGEAIGCRMVRQNPPGIAQSEKDEG